jgi:thiamine biosynthesis lipoprotein
MDPRTGRPAAPWGSVTVLSPDPLVADILSTALFVMGPEAGLAWADRHPGIGAVFLVRRPGGLEVRASTGACRLLDAPPHTP